MEKKIEVSTEDGHIIYGTLNWQESHPQKLIIFVHGFGGNQNSHLFFNGAKFFSQSGFAILRIDLYSSQDGGRNLLDCSLQTHAGDINEIIEYVQSDYEEIYLVGHSLGGPSILWLPQNVRAIVLWDPSLVLKEGDMDYWTLDDTRSVYVNMTGVEMAMSKEMYEEWSKSDESMIKKMKVSTKIICAGNGSLAERWNTILNKIKVRYEYVIIDGAGHGFDEEGKEDVLFEETLKYLQKF